MKEHIYKVVKNLHFYYRYFHKKSIAVQGWDCCWDACHQQMLNFFHSFHWWQRKSRLQISLWLNNRFFLKAVILEIVLRNFDFSGDICDYCAYTNTTNTGVHCSNNQNIIHESVHNYQSNVKRTLLFMQQNISWISLGLLFLR